MRSGAPWLKPRPAPSHVMSRYAPSRFSRGFDCRDILVIGHPGNRMGIDIGVAALDI